MFITKLWMGPIHPSFPYLGLNEMLLSKYISGGCGSVSAAWLVALLQQKLWHMEGAAPRLWPCPSGSLMVTPLGSASQASPMAVWRVPR